jgi:cytochrome b
MKKIPVYDLPVRLFHWLFALLFIAAFAIVKLVDDESPLFSYHMLAGLTIAFLLVLRLIWGIIGTTYARFSSFKLNPVELIQYLKDVVFTKTKSYLGHNPASSYAAVVMFACAIGLAISGILMSTGGENDTLEEIHELLSNIFLISVLVHVLGIVFHHIKHRDSLWSSMLDGKKGTSSDAAGIKSTRPVAFSILVILFVSWIGYLVTNYDSNTQTLNMMGTELRLGETEYESGHEYEGQDEDNDDD